MMVETKPLHFCSGGMCEAMDMWNSDIVLRPNSIAAHADEGEM